MPDKKPPISSATPDEASGQSCAAAPVPASGSGPRLRLLLLCLALGVAIAATGQWLSGRAEWFLAIPLVVALGWLLVADPSQCASCQGKDRNLL
jgi:hypothetical protein